ncbi:tetratricopeptide repeat family protein [Pseudomonas aeruginosa]|uniref:penicillin-binding protein activator LpoP n=3 Tax=Pseudomonas aeruginosa TaxID=287 RepID=UPI000D74EA69|nr:penicillin-binding protein activator LpoP [Pseudomonas aeruginosa]AWQ82181.1 tetratricopeptide repeat family protein [Pseudomonas aeruginosa]MCV4113817.1 penicillin-binding protein activator LpoP [Pseudomonas aeruginosa]MCV4246250.1 penicillin-binding protein activator LpoP [Pseudomonas aeruginosa]MCV4252717.1 penicillin-binding protein activator LpoP [Pseudomonas aeruginosa]HBO3291202.1 tetratricopeptide repeat protein [Pseudomonas aeruginosa]
MKKIFVFAALAGSALLAGCASPQHGAIPVVDSGTPVSNQESGGFRITRTQVPRTQQGAATQGIPQGGDSGVVVMVPQGANSAPIQTFPAQSGAAPISSAPLGTAPLGTGTQYQAPASSASTPPLGGSYNMPPSGTASRSAPTGIPASGSAGSLAADEQLDGPVLAMLTTAQQQQGSGDLNSAAASLERAQRIAPREPQVLYRLAQVRLAQGDAAQAEQVARRGLSYANGRPALQAGLWELIAQAREKQGDSAGAALARQKAKVSS